MYYSVFRTGCKDIRIRNGLFGGFQDVRTVASIVKPYPAAELVISIQNEYKFPRFLEFLLSEAVFNCSLKKFRTSFFLVYTALERACKLLYFYHYKITTNPNPGIIDMLKKMQTDTVLSLRVNLSDFDNKYRLIRNAIGHGDTDDYISTNLGFVLQAETENLLKDIDLIFQQLSILLERYKANL